MQRSERGRSGPFEWIAPLSVAADAAAPSLRDQVAQWAKAGATGFHVGLEGTSLAHYLERLEWLRTDVVDGL